MQAAQARAEVRDGVFVEDDGDLSGGILRRGDGGVFGPFSQGGHFGADGIVFVLVGAVEGVVVPAEAVGEQAADLAAVHRAELGNILCAADHAVVLADAFAGDEFAQRAAEPGVVVHVADEEPVV